MEINKEVIEKLARLSNLELDEAETQKMVKDTSEIVVFFDDIKDVTVLSAEQDYDYNVSESVVDKERVDRGTNKETEQFRRREENKLKVPPIFN